MTFINKKGGDTYGKVPKRIAIAKRQGEQNNAWPGQNTVLNVVRGFSLVQEHKESTTLKGRTTDTKIKMGSLK